jgi:hypothetical protein
MCGLPSSRQREGAGVKLDKLVTLFRAPRVDDGFQSRRGAVTQIGRGWAAQLSAASSEAEVMAQEAAVVTCTFLMRAHGIARQIGAADELECDGVRWQVTGILPVKFFNVCDPEVDTAGYVTLDAGSPPLI